MTLTHWNPSTPNRVGLEYTADLLGGSIGAKQLTAGSAFMQTMRSESADVVTAAKVARSIAAPAATSYDNDYSLWLLEICPKGSEVPGTWTVWTGYAPNGDGTNEGWVDAAGASTSLFGSVDEATVNTADYMQALGAAATPSPTMELQFATGAATFAGQRIELRLKLDVSAATLSPTVVSNTITVGFTTSTGVTLVDFAVINTAGTYTFDLPELNPVTGLYWTQADVQAFDAAARATFRTSALGNNIYGSLLITRAYLEIRSVTENRVAFGFVKDPVGAADTLITVTVTQPGSAAGWSKTAAASYSVMFRRVYLGAATLGYIVVDDGATSDAWHPTSPLIPYLFGPTDPGWADYAVAVVGVDTYGVIETAATTAHVAVDGGAIARLVWATSTADVADGQPYAAVRSDPVSATSALLQQFTAPASATYDSVEVAIRYGSTAKPTTDLTVEIQRVSDSVVFGTATASTADVDDAGLIGSTAWRRLSVPLGSVVALVSGTDYQIVFTSATAAAAPYLIQGLDTDPSGSGTGNSSATFGGVLGATIAGVVRPEADVVVWAFNGAAAPTGFGAVGASIGAGWSTLPQLTPVLTPPTVVPYVALSWTATGIGGNFSRYTIQRRDAVDTAWQTIAGLGTESTVAFADYEARVSTSTDYRIRAETSFGAGVWSTVVSALVEIADSCLLFTSNVDRTQTVAALDVYGNTATAGYGFAEAGELVTIPVLGRDTPVVFRPTERSGAVFSRDVILDVVDPSATIPAGPSASSVLRDMAQDAALPYVCVRDQRGNRWFGAVSVPSSSVRAVDGMFDIIEATVKVVETATAPKVASA